MMCPSDILSLSHSFHLSNSHTFFEVEILVEKGLAPFLLLQSDTLTIYKIYYYRLFSHYKEEKSGAE